jgi:hypothetical protein
MRDSGRTTHIFNVCCRQLAVAIMIGLAACAYIPRPPSMPPDECGVLIDLIADLDDPARAPPQDAQNFPPYAFPAKARLNPIAGGPPGDADLTACPHLMDVVQHHTGGTTLALRHPFRDGPHVNFSRVIFDATKQHATVGYSTLFGVVGGASWSLDLDRGEDGHWKLTRWKLGMEF